MRWIEATINTESGRIDELCLRLEQLGISGVAIEDENDFKEFLENNHKFWDYVDDELNARYNGLSRVKFYLEDDENGQNLLETIKRSLETEVCVNYIADEDWANSWRDCYEPLPIGEKLLVVPAWLEADAPGRTTLRLDPGIAFGTGSHPTTRMCLQALESVNCSGKRALDLGCGSGILSIGALLLGCESVVGCDIDPKSPDAAMANAQLNGIDETRYRVYAGDVLSDEGMRKRLGSGYEIVLANIVADVIIPLSGFARRFMAENGVFICSGIIDNRADEVEKTLRREGFEIMAHFNEEEWHAFMCR